MKYKAFRIKTHGSAEISRIIQEKLFKLGYGWLHKSRAVKRTDKPYLVVSTCGTITWDDGWDYSLQDGFPEITLDDLLQMESGEDIPLHEKDLTEARARLLRDIAPGLYRKPVLGETFKFKIGDRVEMIDGDEDIPAGAVGTVIENDDTPYVSWDEFHGDCSGYKGPNQNVLPVNEEELRPVSKDTFKKKGIEVDLKVYEVQEEGDKVIAEKLKEVPRFGDIYINDRLDYFDTAGGTGWVTVWDGSKPSSSMGPTKGNRQKFLLNIFDFAKGDYVRKQDVIDALSKEDRDGDSMIGYLTRDQTLPYYNVQHQVGKALRSLGIIQD